jgi:hypothetical protein
VGVVVVAPIQVEASPLVGFLYLLLFEGDLSPRRLEETLEQLQSMPPAVAIQCNRPDLARYAESAAVRLERIRFRPLAIERRDA